MTSLETENRNERLLPCGRAAEKSVESVEQLQKLFDSLLKKLSAHVSEHGLKNSDVRIKVLETIVFEARHFTALHLLERLAVRHPDVGKATLYRTLPILLESGIIQEGPPDMQGQTLYELDDGSHHDHIVCLDCHHIFEFYDPSIEKQQDNIALELKFKAKSHRHVIYAECSLLRERSGIAP